MNKRTPWFAKTASGCVLAILVIAGPAGAAGPAMKVKKETGAQLFYSLCASCHGAQGLGDGPVAPLLVTAPSDLTRISQRHNGSFPTLDVQRTIDGRGRVAHGTRTMPVWGRQLYFSAKPENDAARKHAEEEIKRLTEFIRSLQKVA